MSIRLRKWRMWLVIRLLCPLFSLGYKNLVSSAQDGTRWSSKAVLTEHRFVWEFVRPKLNMFIR